MGKFVEFVSKYDDEVKKTVIRFYKTIVYLYFANGQKTLFIPYYFVIPPKKEISALEWVIRKIMPHFKDFHLYVDNKNFYIPPDPFFHARALQPSDSAVPMEAHVAVEVSRQTADNLREALSWLKK